MLIVKVFENFNLIDEIHIQNVRPHLTAEEKGIYIYKIRKPARFHGAFVSHKRSDGYVPLLKKVLDFIEEENNK